MSDLFYHRYMQLKGEKGETMKLMEDVNSFFTPSDNILTGQSKVGLKNEAGELLDTTGSDLIDEYVTYVLGLYYSTDNRWFTLTHPEVDVLSDVGRVLDARAEKLYELISLSNYYSVCPSLERDVIVHGHGIIRIDEDEKSFAKCMSYLPERVFFGTNECDEVEDVYIEQEVTGTELLLKFEELNEDKQAKGYFLQNSQSHYKLISYYYENKKPFADKEDQDKKNKRKKFVLKYFIDGISDLDTAWKGNAKANAEYGYYGIGKKVYFSDRHVFPTRDKLMRGTAYGDGIGKKALPRARILNKLVRDLLNISGLSANPPRYETIDFAAENDLHRQGEPLKPGDVFRAPIDDLDTNSSVPPVQLLNVAGDINGLLTMYQIQQGQLVEMLPVAGSIYKSGRQSINEIQQRSSEQEKRLAPLRANYVSEGTIRHLKRFYALAVKKGYFNEERFQLPEGIEDKAMEFAFDAFLLSDYRQNKSLRAAQALGLVANFLSLKPSGADKIDIDKLVDVAFAGNSVMDLLLSDQEVEDQRRQTAEQAAQQQDLAEREVNAKSTKANADILGQVTQVLGGGQ